MKTTLLSAIMAVAFGFGLSTVAAQNADLQEPPTDQQETQTLPEASQPEDDMARADPSEDSENQSSIPKQSEGSVGNPEEQETTGQGQGVKEENADSSQ